ncbi:MAG TPA: hypothetical protein VII47_09870, partial [Actinomycetota bacterium]
MRPESTLTRRFRAAAPAAAEDRPEATPPFVWAVVVLSALLVGGLYLDLWAHAHGRVDQSFFTPWHGLLYSAYALGAAFLTLVAYRSRQRGLPLGCLLPEGYGLSLAGAALFAVAGVGDMIWHMVFGIEREIDALFSPTHLMLAAGGILIVGGPLRAALRRPQVAGRLPVALSLAFVLAILGAMTQFASPLVMVLARAAPGLSGAVPSMPQARTEILSRQPDGTRQTRLTMDTSTSDLQPAWSPDGTTISSWGSSCWRCGGGCCRSGAWRWSSRPQRRSSASSATSTAWCREPWWRVSQPTCSLGGSVRRRTPPGCGCSRSPPQPCTTRSTSPACRQPGAWAGRCTCGP